MTPEIDAAGSRPAKKRMKFVTSPV
ncbi:hypothetical protein Cabther_A2078 [Chloracidobacterium thermophilum B]|uniref:Uncharacterized protein n=1 Tax=Chloracidobacterium thermophilum (strain B) TaxID=981222 RepID=G2LJD2_CHLTF|nr:hypothetical protein Cabther_A2078 [Chloracidobacterium thermophilum B]